MEKERLNKLSWVLLEHKFRYYILCAPIIEDYEYDMLEKEYETLCDKLKTPNSVSNMVDFDTSRPSCKLIMEKLMPVKKKKRLPRKVVV